MAESLWDFASRCYAQPGVAENCLAAQDSVGADVNLLLAAAWLAARGQYWQRNDAAAAIALCADWRMHCVVPLRSVRRYLKEHAADNAIYRHAKTLELEAEAVQLRAIESALHSLPSTGHSPAALLTMNLQAYADAAGLIAIPPLAELTVALGNVLSDGRSQ